MTTGLTAANNATSDDWNGPVGERWAKFNEETERHVKAFGEAALAAAAVRPGERALDIGCGCGGTSFALAEAVGSSGAVFGVDVSEAMLEVANARLRTSGPSHLSFAWGDAAKADLPEGVDLLFSRFGVMFFDDPVAAFTHMRGALKPGGRLAFVCWRHPRENPWAMAPLAAARAALNHNPPPADLTAPGPFAFSDKGRLAGILADAGFTDVSAAPFDTRVILGASPEEAAADAMKFGPVSRLMREFGEERSPEVLPAITAAMSAHADETGVVRMDGAAWIVTAKT
jgi:ubiquinone/menaquinone biosynthesis C-methylase UbiE